jgi:2,4-dienoyl-CoA reductase-like NADH-dependent reductase (Old Yellow Enzyme family)
MSALFTDGQLGSLKLANRIAVSPMCQYVAKQGNANSWHTIHLGSLALSGAAVVFIEATAVEAVGRITPGDLGLWDDATEWALRRTLSAVRDVSATPLVLQLAHAGRKGSSLVPWEGGELISAACPQGWVTEAPSAIPQKQGEALPLAMDSAAMLRVRGAFVAAARRAARLDIDALELHAAHGYLLHQFLSPLSNHRTDSYGGMLENRLRYPLEVLDAVREAFPSDKPIGIKISATDWMENGWDLEQSLVLADALRARGVDWISVSSGGISPLQRIQPAPGYQVPFAEAIRKETGMKTISVGLINDAQQAETIIASGQSDFVALARGMLYDPRWPWHAAAHLGATIAAPPPYWRAPPHKHSGLFQDVKFGTR